MPDNYWLTGPQGSQINIGSWVRPDPGPDFGTHGLLKSIFSDNPLTEGGVLSIEDTGPRAMKYPLIVPSGGISGQSLTTIESQLRLLARPGAVIDLQVDGTPTAEMVRFDVLAGRWEPDYAIFVNRAGRRLGTLELDVQPFGYWPTWILLASSASVGMPGFLAVPGASVNGDYPGFAKLCVAPTNPVNLPLGSWMPDLVGWSLAGRASFNGFYTAAQLTANLTATLLGQAIAPASQTLQIFPSRTQGGWTTLAYQTIPSGLEAAHRGRFRAYAYLQVQPSMAAPFQFAADIVSAYNPGAALASYGPVATLGSPRALASDGPYVAAASNAYHILNLGDLTLPPIGSGIPQDVRVRIWGSLGASDAGVATPIINLAGILLQPLDGPAGVIPRGLAQPTLAAPTAIPGRLSIDSYNRTIMAAVPTGAVGSTIPMQSILGLARSMFPYVSGSTARLDLFDGSHQQRAAYEQEVRADAPRLWYRFMDAPGGVATAATVIDWTGQGNHLGNASNWYEAAAGPLFPPASDFAATMAGNSIIFTSALGQVPTGNNARTIEMWLRPTGINAAVLQIPFSHGDISATGRSFGVILSGTQVGLYTSGNNQILYARAIGDNYWHHLALSYDGTWSTLYVDGEFVATSSLPIVPSTTATWIGLGNSALGGANQYRGGLDEVAMYFGALSAARIRAHYDAARSAIGATSAPVQSADRPFAGVALYYQPRFQFLKGL